MITWKKRPKAARSRQLITNANKYGLIKGSYAAEFLELTPEGSLAVDEEIPNRERVRAKIKLAIEQIEPFNALYKQFVGNKLPAKTALIDAVKEIGASSDAAEEAVDTFIVNLRFLGLLTTLSGADRIISVDHLLDGLPASQPKETLSHTKQSIEPKRSPATTQIITAEHAQYETACFYIAPIGDENSDQRKHSDLFLGSFVEPALEPFDLKLVRAGAIDKPGIITKQVLEYILRSRLVIVDLSFHNPNVFYELGIRHMMRRPIVQIARTMDKVPFDVNQMRTIRIDTSDIYTLVPKIEGYRAEIANQVRRALESADAVDTPINVYFPNLTVALN